MKRDIFLAFYVYIRKRSVIFASLLKPQHYLLEFRVSQTRVRLKLLRESKSLADTLSSAWVEGRENRRQMTVEFKKTIEGRNYWLGHTGDYVKFAVEAGEGYASNQFVQLTGKKFLTEEIILGEEAIVF